MGLFRLSKVFSRKHVEFRHSVGERVCERSQARYQPQHCSVKRAVDLFEGIFARVINVEQWNVTEESHA